MSGFLTLRDPLALDEVNRFVLEIHAVECRAAVTLLGTCCVERPLTLPPGYFQAGSRPSGRRAIGEPITSAPLV